MLKVGQRGSYSQIISEDDISCYAMIVGDTNPIHLDEKTAMAKGFRHCIAHGMLTGGLISTVLGTIFPGEGTIYLEQNLKFIKPVYVNQKCTANVSVEEVINSYKGIYKLKTEVVNEEKEKVIDGFAVVKYLEGTEIRTGV